MTQKAFQDYYPEDLSLCYGCGRLNNRGLHIQSFWDGDISICTFNPQPYHTAVKGFVYGGLLASLIDCHSTGTAAAAVYRQEGRAMDTNPPLRFVTASLHVDYIQPTPLNSPLRIQSTIETITPKKVIVLSELYALDTLRVRGTVVAVKMPKNF